jgi:hypothetical protein
MKINKSRKTNPNRIGSEELRQREELRYWAKKINQYTYEQLINRMIVPQHIASKIFNALEELEKIESL